MRPNSRGRIDPYTALDALMRRLNELGNAVIVVDDSNWLDETSTRVLLTARQRTNTPIIAASDMRMGSGAKGLLEYLSPQIKLKTIFFHHDEIHQVLRGHLGAPIEPQSLSVIANLSGGLPGLALSMARSMQLNGSLQMGNDILTLEIPEWGSILKGVGGKYLLGLPEREKTALRAVANCVDSSLARLRAMPVWEQLPALERRGLVEIIHVEHGPELAIFPPALRESLRGDLGPIAFSAQENVAASATSLPVSPGFSLSKVARSEYSDSVEYSRNAVLLSHRQRMQLYYQAQVLGRKWEQDSSAENALRYVQALVGMAAPVETIKHVLAATDPDDLSPYGLYFTAWRVSFVAMVANDLKAAQRLLDDMKKRRPEFAAGYRAIEAHVQLTTKSVPSDELLRVTDEEADPLSTMFLYICQAETELVKGNQTSAIKALDQATHSERNIDRIGDTLRAIAMLHDGRISEALEFITSLHEASWQSPGRLWAESPAYVKALLLAYTGRVAAFDHHMTVVAATASTASLNVNQLAATYSLASVFAQQRGLTDKARSYAQQALSIGSATSIYPGIPPAVAGVAAEGDLEEALAITWKETEDRLAKGYTSAAIMLGSFVLVNQPNVERARRLVEAAQNTESVLLKLIAEYAWAASEGRGEALMRVSEDFLEHNLNCHAAQAAVIAAVHFYRQGSVSRSIEVIERAWVILTTRCEDLTTIMTPFIDEVGLTAREIEVTALLNTGQTNQQLADRLYVSVRTIEQHILRAKTKLGFVDRDELAHAATTWLSPFVANPASLSRESAPGETAGSERT